MTVACLVDHLCLFSRKRLEERQSGYIDLQGLANQKDHRKNFHVPDVTVGIHQKK